MSKIKTKKIPSVNYGWADLWQTVESKKIGTEGNAARRVNELSLNANELQDDSRQNVTIGELQNIYDEDESGGGDLDEDFLDNKLYTKYCQNFYQLRRKVQKYMSTDKLPHDGPDWVNASEVPTSSGFMNELEQYGDGCALANDSVNIIKGVWQSKEHYLERQYRLLREDAVGPLRAAVYKVRGHQCPCEKDFGNSIGIYDKVKVASVMLASIGVTVNVKFSLRRVGKKINWDQSKRLMTGSLVALTPVEDMFRTKLLIGTIAARPLSGLQEDPPEIDLIFSDVMDTPLDTEMEYIMIEERSSFFEANRHSLLALQKLHHEAIPFHEHIVDLKTEVKPPEYILSQSKYDIKQILNRDDKNDAEPPSHIVDVLNDWPRAPNCPLDESQLEALQRMLTKRISIIQGPPGTGKTHISVQALKILLDNTQIGEPPLIVTCQTNHALDQLLRHVSTFEERFMRLGSRSKDQDVIKKRTLLNIRRNISFPQMAVGDFRKAVKSMANIAKRAKVVLEPLRNESREMLDASLYQRYGILNSEQIDCLEKGNNSWTQGRVSTIEGSGVFGKWLGTDLMEQQRTFESDESFFEFEEAELEFEAFKEIEAEALISDGHHDMLRGIKIVLHDNFAARQRVNLSNDECVKMLKENNLYKIDQKYRSAIFMYCYRELKQRILQEFRTIAEEFTREVGRRKTASFVRDMYLLQQCKMIGITVTGFSKFRGMLSALEPKIVLIEEAAQTMEAPVVATLLPSVQHMILIGDHLQLRPQCHLRRLENKPYYLNVSLFERLVRNGVEYSSLRRQRRMIPEVRRLLAPIYGDLIIDHPSVCDKTVRGRVPGMGLINSFFFTHTAPESQDDHASSVNEAEADIIVGFFEYLILNGLSGHQITILTFYNGQRKRIFRLLGKCANLRGHELKVVTVDSYQGEENDVILLSLVRNNQMSQIGFVGISNRVCVAISRARIGLYIFGNGELLCACNKTWLKILGVMSGIDGEPAPNKPRRRLGLGLPLTCKNHGNVVYIDKPQAWKSLHGGCRQKCHEVLPCGHACFLNCHPFPHDQIKCRAMCGAMLSCGHTCQQTCGSVCFCTPCNGGGIISFDVVDQAYMQPPFFSRNKTLPPATVISPGSLPPTVSRTIDSSIYANTYATVPTPLFTSQVTKLAQTPVIVSETALPSAPVSSSVETTSTTPGITITTSLPVSLPTLNKTTTSTTAPTPTPAFVSTSAPAFAPAPAPASSSPSTKTRSKKFIYAAKRPLIAQTKNPSFAAVAAAAAAAAALPLSNGLPELPLPDMPSPSGPKRYPCVSDNDSQASDDLPNSSSILDDPPDLSSLPIPALSPLKPSIATQPFPISSSCSYSDFDNALPTFQSVLPSSTTPLLTSVNKAKASPIETLIDLELVYPSIQTVSGNGIAPEVLTHGMECAALLPQRVCETATLNSSSSPQCLSPVTANITLELECLSNVIGEDMLNSLSLLD